MNLLDYCILLAQNHPAGLWLVTILGLVVLCAALTDRRTW